MILAHVWAPGWEDSEPVTLLPSTRLWAELEQVREVVNVYAAGRGRKAPLGQAVLGKLTTTQERLVEGLGLRRENTPV